MKNLPEKEHKLLMNRLAAFKAMNDMRAMIGLEPDNSLVDELRASGLDIPDLDTISFPEMSEEEMRDHDRDFFNSMMAEETEFNSERKARGEEPLETFEEYLKGQKRLQVYHSGDQRP